MRLLKLKPESSYLYTMYINNNGYLIEILVSDSIMRLFYFTPRWLVNVTPGTRKAQKELYERRQQYIGDEDDYFIFSFISCV